MKYRALGKTGFNISEVSLGTWQIGGKWGSPFDEETAHTTLSRAVDLGINFFDTADKYNDGMSEKAIGRVLKERNKRIYVATKCGRGLQPHVADGYNEKNIRAFVNDSLKNLGVETLDIIQLHCPPTEVFYRPEVFEVLDSLKKEGKIIHYGVSVEKVEEGLKAIEYPGLSTVQIIFNMFRQRPKELLFPRAKEKNIGIIVRVPLASGLLTGKFTPDTTFSKGDHRYFNRDGSAFDRGETFAGIDYKTGLKAVEELKKVFPNQNLAQMAIKWILMHDAVSAVIPGASHVSQLESNVVASDLPDLTNEQMKNVDKIYKQYIKPLVHLRW